MSRKATVAFPSEVFRDMEEARREAGMSRSQFVVRSVANALANGAKGEAAKAEEPRAPCPKCGEDMPVRWHGRPHRVGHGPSCPGVES